VLHQKVQNTAGGITKGIRCVEHEKMAQIRHGRQRHKTGVFGPNQIGIFEILIDCGGSIIGVRK
jgi:hypothetical protein